MSTIRFEWSEDKSHSNLRKHGVSFDNAAQVFVDPRHLVVADPFEGEERWRVYGLVAGVAVVMLVCTWRDDADSEVVRIISARLATRGERQDYDRQDR